jgi:hypothetical protein
MHHNIFGSRQLGGSFSLFADISSFLILCTNFSLVSCKQPLTEMQGKTAYIRTKVVGPFPGPCASGSYMHRADPFTMLTWIQVSEERLTYFAVYLSPQISISTSGASMRLIDFRARISTKCANENTRIEELNLQSDQVKEFVQADENVPQKRSAKIHDFCLGIPFGKFEYHQCKTVCLRLDGYKLCAGVQLSCK